MILAERRNKNVVVAVVVKIADGHAHAVQFHAQPGFLRYIGKRPVLIVVIQRQRGVLAHMPRPVHTVDEHDVLPAIVVVIDEADAGAHGFREPFLSENTRIVLEWNSVRARYASKM